VHKVPVDRLVLESDAPFISDIIRVEQLKRSLLYCLAELRVLKNMEISKCIFETSRRLLET
jgi:Tat protein secretion system quality control protein TatD with DNase activity